MLGNRIKCRFDNEIMLGKILYRNLNIYVILVYKMMFWNVLRNINFKIICLII